MWQACRLAKKSFQGTIFLKPKEKPIQQATIQFKFLHQGNEIFLFGIIDMACKKVYDAQHHLLPAIIGQQQGEIYLEIDLEGKIIASSLRGYQQLGYSQEELVGKPLSCLFPNLQSLSSYLAHAKPFELYDHFCQSQTGQIQKVDSYFVPSFKQNKLNGYWVCNFLQNK